MNSQHGRLARLQEELQRSPLSGHKSFSSWLTSPGFVGVFPLDLVDEIGQHIGMDIADLMRMLVPFARCFSDPYVSNYSAACIARGQSGALYAGANAEFLGLPLNLAIHAEQTATINAWEHGEVSLSHLAISAAPCGQCRQFLYEISGADHLEIILPEGSPRPLGTLLPLAFVPQDLGVTACLMAPQDTDLSLDIDGTDGLVTATLAAARRSYAPYSHAYAAVALVASDGRTFTGRYAENAAFNPSVLPATAALALLRLAGSSPADIARAVLVETAAPVSHATVSQILLRSLCSVRLEVFSAHDHGLHTRHET